MPPPAQMLLASARQNSRSDSRVEPGGRLVEQPERTPADQQPGDRRAAALAGRQIAEGQMADGAESDQIERRLDAEFADRRQKSRQKARFSATVSAGFIAF